MIVSWIKERRLFFLLLLSVIWIGGCASITIANVLNNKPACDPYPIKYGYYFAPSFEMDIGMCSSGRFFFTRLYYQPNSWTPKTWLIRGGSFSHYRTATKDTYYAPNHLHGPECFYQCHFYGTNLAFLSDSDHVTPKKGEPEFNLRQKLILHSSKTGKHTLLEMRSSDYASGQAFFYSSDNQYGKKTKLYMGTVTYEITFNDRGIFCYPCTYKKSGSEWEKQVDDAHPVVPVFFSSEYLANL